MHRRGRPTSGGSGAATPWFVGEFGVLTPIAVGLLVWAWLGWEGGAVRSLEQAARDRPARTDRTQPPDAADPGFAAPMA